MDLADGEAPGRVGIQADTFGPALVELLRAGGDKEVTRIVDDFARWYEKSFEHWWKSTTIEELVVKGPVPSFAPPYVPVGPVVMGDNLNAPGHLRAPHFGKGR